MSERGGSEPHVNKSGKTVRAGRVGGGGGGVREGGRDGEDDRDDDNEKG